MNLWGSSPFCHRHGDDDLVPIHDSNCAVSLDRDSSYAFYPFLASDLYFSLSVSVASLADRDHPSSVDRSLYLRSPFFFSLGRQTLIEIAFSVPLDAVE